MTQSHTLFRNGIFAPAKVDWTPVHLLVIIITPGTPRSQVLYPFGFVGSGFVESGFVESGFIVGVLGMGLLGLGVSRCVWWVCEIGCGQACYVPLPHPYLEAGGANIRSHFRHPHE